MAAEPSEGPRYSSPEERHRAERHRKRRLLALEIGAALVAGTALLVVVLLIAGEDESAEARDDGREHATVASCSVDADGFGVAEVSIANGSDEYSNYLVELAFVDADGVELEVRNANVHGVRSGETAIEEVRTTDGVTEGVGCEIRSAFRFFAGAAPRD